MAVVVVKDNYLLVANVGDSEVLSQLIFRMFAIFIHKILTLLKTKSIKVVLSESGKPITLTEVHNPKVCLLSPSPIF